MHKAQISVGVVGLGRAGWHLHLEPMFEHGGFRIAAVADPAPERLKEAQELTSCTTYPSLEAMLKQTEAELIVIATPSFSHFADALAVLQSGRHCLLEKPLALNLEDADTLIRTAQEKGLQLFVHHQHLHRTPYHHFKGVLDSGVLGKFFHLRAFWGGYNRRWDWQCLLKNGGGQLNNTCPHLFSIVLPLIGGKAEVTSCQMRNIKDAGDAEDHVEITLRGPTGITANLTVSSAAAIPAPTWMLFGSSGALQSDGTTSRLRYYDPAQAPALEVIDAAAPGRKYLVEELPWQEKELQVDTAGPVTTFHQNVYDVLANNGQQMVTPQSALEVMRVTEQARALAAR